MPGWSPPVTARSTQVFLIGIRGMCFYLRGGRILKAVLSRCLGLVHVIQELRSRWFIGFLNVSTVAPKLCVAHFNQITSVGQLFGAGPRAPRVLPRGVSCVLSPPVGSPPMAFHPCCIRTFGTASSLLRHAFLLLYRSEASEDYLRLAGGSYSVVP